MHVQGITLVVSTPYMDEAEQCTRVALMMAGRLAVCDTPPISRPWCPANSWPSGRRTPSEPRGPGGVAGIADVQLYGDQLRILTADADALMPGIRARLAERGLTIDDLRPGRVRMEEAFVYLTGHRIERRSAGEEA